MKKQSGVIKFNKIERSSILFHDDGNPPYYNVVLKIPFSLNGKCGDDIPLEERNIYSKMMKNKMVNVLYSKIFHKIGTIILKSVIVKEFFDGEFILIEFNIFDNARRGAEIIEKTFPTNVFLRFLAGSYNKP